MAIFKEPQIRIEDFTYNLPQSRIASYPLLQRDNSKLLIYNKGTISESHFYSLSDYIPSNSLMVFNNTKVVPARLLFRKETGALIEIFCLEPFEPKEYAISFATTASSTWKVIVGNAKKWKNGSLSLYTHSDNDESSLLCLTASLIKRDGNSSIVRFDWKGDIPFSKVLDICGKIPIPPYLNRDTEAIDTERYQTLYAKYRGSVAAPTAGLHFTDSVLDSLKQKSIECHNLCLHVGAGTFLPVKTEYIGEHIMHSEPFTVSKLLLERLANLNPGEKVVSVGTTSTRSLESLYYLGVQCIKANPINWTPSFVSQWEPYQEETPYSTSEAFNSLLNYMEINNLETLSVKTQIIIVPSYKFKVVDMQITNFHQPQSTLLLLIAAFVGEENWRGIYDYALNNDFRFLSYGDSSLLIR